MSEDKEPKLVPGPSWPGEWYTPQEQDCECNSCEYKNWFIKRGLVDNR